MGSSKILYTVTEEELNELIIVNYLSINMDRVVSKLAITHSFNAIELFELDHYIGFLFYMSTGFYKFRCCKKIIDQF